jgi:hypothetical protein
VKWYYFIAWPITLGTALYHNSEKKDAENAIRNADNNYKQVLADAGEQMSAVIGLRGKFKSGSQLVSLLISMEQQTAKTFRL